MNELLQQMLAELESHRLTVMLVPLNPRLRNYNEGGMKRVVSDKSPRWYAKFCAQHPSSRGVRRGKFDTRIRRRDVLRILTKLTQGRRTWSKYADELRRLALTTPACGR